MIWQWSWDNKLFQIYFVFSDESPSLDPGAEISLLQGENRFGDLLVSRACHNFLPTAEQIMFLFWRIEKCSGVGVSILWCHYFKILGLIILPNSQNFHVPGLRSHVLELTFFSPNPRTFLGWVFNPNPRMFSCSGVYDTPLYCTEWNFVHCTCALCLITEFPFIRSCYSLLSISL